MRIQAVRLPWLGKTSYTAWEPSTVMGTHSSIAFIDGECYGKIGTDPDQSLFDGMPIGRERSEAVNRAYDDRYAVAYAAILAEYPECADGEFDGGEILL